MTIISLIDVKSKPNEVLQDHPRYYVDIPIMSFDAIINRK
jgi:hypothetical protein